MVGTVSIPVTGAPSNNRLIRRPQHPFHVVHFPFVLQPFLIAPVLPGDTMRNLMIQSRCVTDPVANGLIGWWLEYYVFYVKLTDLDDRDTFKEMMIDLNTSVAGLKTTANTENQHRGTNIDYVAMCLKRVTEEYFRDDGEAYVSGGRSVTQQSTANRPLARIQNDGWWNSIADVTTVGVATDLDTADVVTDKAIEAALRAYEYMKSAGLMNMTYEDFLRSYGVRGAAVEEPHKPELIRYVRDWQYPSNTVDPTTGNPSAAVSWVVQERADKDRFFAEPGFIFGVTCARPKVYYREQDGNGTEMMDHAFAWLPAILREDPGTSVREIDNANGPWAGATNDYWVDLRDLFVHGDAFTNYPRTAINGNFVDLPTAALQHRYPDIDDLRGFFVQPQTPVDKYVRQDGIVSLTIASTVRDETPRAVIL